MLLTVTMFVLVDLQRFHTQCVDMSVVYLITKFHKSSSNVSLFIATKSKPSNIRINSVFHLHFISGP
jgi:hypothetical protein